MQPHAALLGPAAGCFLLLLLMSCAVAQPGQQGRTNGIQFNLKNFGGARAAVGAGKMRSIREKAGLQHKSLEELFQELDNDDDLGVDLEEEVLVYSCKPRSEGREEGPPVVTAEAEAAAAPLVGPEPLSGASTDLPGHHPHHHHRRQLLQQADATPEWNSTWTPDKIEAGMGLLYSGDSCRAFLLHSRPAASKKIYLDFDGHITTNGYWNTQNGGLDIVTPMWNYLGVDAYPYSFTFQECITIAGLWRQVAEDFSMFDVDITTEEPVNAPKADWIRVAIGGTDWTGKKALGLSTIGFGFLPVSPTTTCSDDHCYGPVFVFSNEPDFSQTPRRVADVISHEVGHMLGLNHDGKRASGTTYEMYSGHNGWSPIMGNILQNQFTQWSKGEYAGATTQEDDCAIMSQKVPYIRQLHGSSAATATPLGGVLSVDTATARVTGVVRMPTDVEFMWFRASRAGPATFQVLVQPNYPNTVTGRSNLNLQLRIFDQSGAQLTAAMGVGIGRFDYTLPAAGIYYTSVAGVGSGADASTGYTSYGSRGVYQLVVTYPSDGNMSLPTQTPSTPVTVAWTGSKTSKGKQLTCTITATLVGTASGAPLSIPVTISGTWSADTSSWTPYSATVTSSTGAARFTSKAYTATSSTANKCTFTTDANSIALPPGYALADSSVLSNTL